MQRRDAVHFEDFDDAVEHEADPDRRNEETDNASDRIDPHWTDRSRQALGIGQADIGSDHRRNNCGREGDEGKHFRR